MTWLFFFDEHVLNLWIKIHFDILGGIELILIIRNI